MIKSSKVEKTYREIQAHTMFLCDDLSDLQYNLKICILRQLNQLNVDDEEENIKTSKEEVQYLADKASQSMQEIFDTMLLIQDKIEETVRVE